MDFDWDIFNIEHIARHKVERDEVEEAATDPALITRTAHRGPQNQPRSALIGATEAGRVLHIVFEYRETRIRVVTARPATYEERQLYYEEEEL